MSIQPDEEIDIRGEVCPYTFVKSKLKIELMTPGQVLRIVTDHEPATKNVPRSMENEGHEILSPPHKIADNTWEFYIKKN
ncbi:MAG: sulfurtransferase TusA family protein [Nitrospinae bacterium]|nr:sulfurtransferase TusA family protein [Nitrospinota bacterium]